MRRYYIDEKALGREISEDLLAVDTPGSRRMAAPFESRNSSRRVVDRSGILWGGIKMDSETNVKQPEAT